MTQIPSRSCDSCGTPTPPGALFCPSCGTATPTEVGGGTGAELHTSLADEEQEYRGLLQGAVGAEYEILERIGEGGFGVVYRALDARLKRQVAIKMLRQELFVLKSTRLRFHHEAQAAAQLRHPHIVPIYSVGENERVAFIVMPLIHGESLATRLAREGRIASPEARRILVEAANALQCAHEAGIVHRDVKPENMMLEGKDQRVLLTDFGIAKAMDPASQSLTGSGAVLGTPLYMSPEQASGSSQIDPRSDVYSLGVVGYQMLAGVPPFRGASAQELLLQRLTELPRALNELRVDVPRDLSDAVMRCLARQPAERWSSASDLAQALAERPSPIFPRWRLPVGLGIRRQFMAGVAGALAIIGVLLAAQPHLYHRALDYWFGVSGDSSGWAPGKPFGWYARSYQLPERRLVNINDSVLLVVEPYNSFYGLTFWDGVAWSFAQSPREEPGVPAARGDSLYFFGEFRGHGFAVFRPRGGTYTQVSAVQDTALALGVTAVWTDEKSMVLGGFNGDIVRNASGRWRREPTGSHDLVFQIFGATSQALYALTGLPAGRTSILAFDGFRWKPTRIWPDSSLRYEAAAVLETGTVIVIGVTTDWRSIILVQDANQSPWRPLDVPLPRKMSFGGVWGRSLDDLVVWGHLGCSDFDCSWRVLQVKGGITTEVHDLPSSPVMGAASFRGQPYLLFADGTLWTRRDSIWGLVGEVPTLRIRDADFTDSAEVQVGAGYFSSNLGRLTLRQFENFKRAVLAGNRTIWLLTEGGRVYRHACTGLSDQRCATTPLPFPGSGQVRDIGVLPSGNVLAVGSNGLLTEWRGSRWIPLQTSQKPIDDFIRVARGHNRPPTVLGRHSVVQLDAKGHWVTTYLSNDPRSDPEDLAVFQDSSVVVLHGGGFFCELVVHGRQLPCRTGRTNVSQYSTSLGLDDGRIVVATADPTDPLLGGTLAVGTRGDSGAVPNFQFRRIPSPRTIDLVALVEFKLGWPGIRVRGSGMYADDIPLDALEIKRDSE